MELFLKGQGEKVNHLSESTFFFVCTEDNGLDLGYHLQNSPKNPKVSLIRVCMKLGIMLIWAAPFCCDS